MKWLERFSTSCTYRNFICEFTLTFDLLTSGFVPKQLIGSWSFNIRKLVKAICITACILYSIYILTFTVKYTKARVRGVFLLFGYVYRQNDFFVFAENNLHVVFVWFWCGLCIKPINFRVLGFLQSQLLFVIMVLPVCTPIVEKFFSFQLQAS